MNPQLWIVAGPNGAGKTTLVYARLAGRIVVVNPDAIAAAMPRPDERAAGVRAVVWRNQLIADRTDFAVETTLTGNTPLKLMRDAQAAGYEITLAYVGLSSAELSASRVIDRVRRGGHAVPLTHVERRYPDTIAKLPIAIGIADRTYVFDNSGRERRLLLRRAQGRNLVVSTTMPAWAREALRGVL